MTELKGNLEKLVPLYPSIRAPTVILVGDRDLTVSNDVHAQALVEAIPNARLEILQGVGHMLHHARPDRVAAAIDEVLGASEANSSSPATVSSRDRYPLHSKTP